MRLTTEKFKLTEEQIKEQEIELGKLREAIDTK